MANISQAKAKTRRANPNERITAAYVQQVKLKKRAAWRGIIKFTDDKGKSRQITKLFPAGVDTKAQAFTELVKWRATVDDETTAPDASLTVAEYAKAFIDDLELGGTVEPSTIKGYRSSQKHIESEFAGIRLRDLTTKHVTQWRNKMIRSGLSPVTITKHLRFLRAVCAHAVKVHDLVWNPVDAVKPPKRSQTEPAALDVDTVRVLVKKLEESEPTPLIVSAAIGVFTGMREGEICGLRWSDVDLENRTITVANAIGAGKGGDYIKTPKNESSRRTVPIPPQLVPMLERRRAIQHADWLDVRMRLELPKTNDEFNKLFVAGTIDGRHASPAVLSRAWKEFADQNGITDTKGNRAVFHSLRHSYASLLIAQGFEDVTVAKLMGHAKASMTKDVYAAAFEARKKAAAKSVGEAIGTAIAEPKPAEVIVLDRASNE